MTLRPVKRNRMQHEKSYKRKMNVMLNEAHKEKRLDGVSYPRIISMRYSLSLVEAEKVYFDWLRKKGYIQINTWQQRTQVGVKCPKCNNTLSTTTNYKELWCNDHGFLDAIECGIVPTLKPVKKSYKTKAGINSVAGTKAFGEFLPSGWKTTYKGKVEAPSHSPLAKYHVLRVNAPDGSYITMWIVETIGQIEMQSINVERPGRRHGTTVMQALKEYADSKNDIIIIKDVANEKFFDRFSWLEKVKTRDRDPDYIYEVS